jgi:hypothetical protein
MWDEHTTRNPMLLLRLSGWLWLRLSARVVLIVDPGAAAQHTRLDHGTPSRFPGEHQRSRLAGIVGFFAGEKNSRRASRGQ